MCFCRVSACCPNDFIMAVQTNPRFVEALMVGANHEMGREMLWQGFPTDQRGTPFQHFWQRLDGKTTSSRFTNGCAAPLGSQPGSTPMTVLLIPRPAARAVPESVDLCVSDRTPQEKPSRRTVATTRWIRREMDPAKA